MVLWIQDPPSFTKLGCRISKENTMSQSLGAPQIIFKHLPKHGNTATHISHIYEDDVPPSLHQHPRLPSGSSRELLSASPGNSMVHECFAAFKKRV